MADNHIKQFKFQKLITILSLFLFVLLPKTLLAQCAVSSVQVCGVADDYMSVYIDGYLVGNGNDFQFANVLCSATGCNISSCNNGQAWGVCSPVCITVPNT